MIHVPILGYRVWRQEMMYTWNRSSNRRLYLMMGSTPEVVLDNNAALNAQPIGTPEDATRFLLSSLRRFGCGFGMATGKRTGARWL